MKSFVSHKQASQLLHNKFVVVLGDSIQRAVYKDLVLLLQKDRPLTRAQLRTKGEMSFEQDCLVEGGCLNELHNGTAYREVRQFQSDHHLVRFYFLTRIYSPYMQSVLEDFRQGLKPDVVIMNSCVWDISRYSRDWTIYYKENLHRFFEELKTILPEETLVIWNLTMPLGEKLRGGFLVPEIAHMASELRFDVIEANFFSGTLADAYKLDVVDLHFHFRFSLQHRTNDGVHWNHVAHRRITSVLLQHAADAWGVTLKSLTTAAEYSLQEIQLSTNTDKDRHVVDHKEASFTRSHRYSDWRNTPPLRPYPPVSRRALPPPPPSPSCGRFRSSRFFDADYSMGRFQYSTNTNNHSGFKLTAPRPYPLLYGRVPLPPALPPPSHRFPDENRPTGNEFEPYRQHHHQDVLKSQRSGSGSGRHHYAPYPPRRPGHNNYNYY